MSNLTTTEILTLEKIIDKKSKDKGYVWDFSNSKFKDFVESYVSIDIYDDKYIAPDGASKMKRLKTFLKIEDDNNVTMLLNALKEYGTKRKLLCKANIQEIDKMIKKLQKHNKQLRVDTKLYSDEKKVEILIKDINDKLLKNEYELAIDRLHTFFKGFVEKICGEMKISIKDKSLDALYNEMLKFIHDNNIFDEGTTKDILSATKKIMKSFDYARNNRSFAHMNDIMKQNDAQFLCAFIIDLYKFLSKINWKLCVRGRK